jgi:hypothetical protein
VPGVVTVWAAVMKCWRWRVKDFDLALAWRIAQTQLGHGASLSTA